MIILIILCASIRCNCETCGNRWVVSRFRPRARHDFSDANRLRPIADSIPGQGSSFHLELPFAVLSRAGSLCDTPPVQTATLHRPERPLTVLIAEDNLLNQRTIELILNKVGHHPICTSNGQEALERWRSGGIDAILMDIHMPVMNGMEAVEQIRKEEQATGLRTPIIALTADALKGTEEHLLKAGFDGYLTKPVKIRDLADALLKVMDEAAS